MVKDIAINAGELLLELMDIEISFISQTQPTHNSLSANNGPSDPVAAKSFKLFISSLDAKNLNQLNLMDNEIRKYPNI